MRIDIKHTTLKKKKLYLKLSNIFNILTIILNFLMNLVFFLELYITIYYIY